MRLTLRTMLCYLDDVLDPVDAKELGAKIEESEYATNVVHRVRTSMRRLRLGAPALSGKEMGFDPNTVADYLDNTLPPEQVADFERVCLDVESEAHLAEVAACHQILTLVLGEPAEVPVSLRHRVYGMGQLDEQQLSTAAMAFEAPLDDRITTAATTNGAGASHRVDPPEQTAATTATDDKVEPAKGGRQKPEIPEYLRQGSSGQRTWPMALAVLLLVILLGGIAVTLWPPGGNRRADVAQNNIVGDEAESNPADSDPVTTSDGATPIAEEGETTTSTQASGGQPADETQEPADGSDSRGASPDVIPAIVPPIESGDPTVTEPPPEPVEDNGPPKATDDPDGEAVARIDPLIGDGGAGEATTEPVLPPVDKVAGHYISSAQVMVRWDAEATAWKRLAPRTPVKPGDQIRSLPTYRPLVLLNNDIQITFSDECIAEIGNPVEGHPAVRLIAGKTVIATMGKAGNSVVVHVGGRDILLTMMDAEAALALSVTPFHQPGDDPEAEIAHVKIVAVVAGGQVQWQQAGSEAVLLDYGQQVSILDDGLPKIQVTEAPPKWVKMNDISDIDRLASATLEPMLNDERPMEIALAERAEHPRVEVRSLAARSLASINKFDAIIDTFSDESLKSYWSEHFDRLQGAMARDPKTAVLVREAVERRKGEDADRIYRLLWGYNPEQLKSGSDKVLVDYLKHDSLDVRVLAINNLRSITSRTFGYHPHLPEARRRTPVREWEQAAATGAIAYLNPPADLPKRKAAP